MARKNANNLKKGNYFINDEDGAPYMVLENIHSKSGKHGSAKSRINCVSLFTQKKKSLTMTADTSVEIPEIVKRRGQLISIDEPALSMQVMDTETYETIDIGYPLGDNQQEMDKIKQLLSNPDQQAETEVEFWTVTGKSFATRMVLPKY